eukprot:CAMPEP_0175057204 /NCGR_PEP_ID=MMETSP0052_2-20121109/11128_1 /TAXON_ID=51329 ORGANISM="Polytomella parva, Strain SAG 63-3" /NCGR_SAMPLE_ID=MMETSP0052_2 /ASSEMBLY_ACC=CAM_ASM_000194 /LENGTH=354 /DNA_ID=CAMNT_0016322379 /DNA_START=56 /DNA_END=1116 /DNA_ORIENTATION=-
MDDMDDMDDNKGEKRERKDRDHVQDDSQGNVNPSSSATPSSIAFAASSANGNISIFPAMLFLDNDELAEEELNEIQGMLYRSKLNRQVATASREMALEASQGALEELSKKGVFGGKMGGGGGGGGTSLRIGRGGSMKLGVGGEKVRGLATATTVAMTAVAHGKDVDGEDGPESHGGSGRRIGGGPKGDSNNNGLKKAHKKLQGGVHDPATNDGSDLGEARAHLQSSYPRSSTSSSQPLPRHSSGVSDSSKASYKKPLSKLNPSFSSSASTTSQQNKIQPMNHHHHHHHNDDNSDDGGKDNGKDASTRHSSLRNNSMKAAASRNLVSSMMNNSSNNSHALQNAMIVPLTEDNLNR